jgi:hypothetical protein
MILIASLHNPLLTQILGAELYLGAGTNDYI